MPPNINKFFSSFANDKNFALNFPFLWTVNIADVNSGSINTVLNEAGEKWNAKINPDDLTEDGNILVAREVVLPNESSNFSALVASDNMGGFLPGYGMSARANFLDRTFSISFIETQMDLEHNFFRPWMIALGIQGLLEWQSGEVLKATIEVRQYSNKGEFIKGFHFRKAFPKVVDGFTLNYEDTEFKIKHVVFASENYEQL